MAHELLDDEDVGTVLAEVRCEGVAKRMEGDALAADAGLSQDRAKGLADRRLTSSGPVSSRSTSPMNLR